MQDVCLLNWCCVLSDCASSLSLSSNDADTALPSGLVSSLTSLVSSLNQSGVKPGQSGVKPDQSGVKPEPV